MTLTDFRPLAGVRVEDVPLVWPRVLPRMDVVGLAGYARSGPGTNRKSSRGRCRILVPNVTNHDDVLLTDEVFGGTGSWPASAPTPC